MSVDTNIEPTLAFFENNLGKRATRELIISTPALLSLSLEKRYKPRLKEAQELKLVIDRGVMQRMGFSTAENWSTSLVYQANKVGNQSKELDVSW